MTGDRAEEIAKQKLSLTQRTLMKAGSLTGATNSTEAIQALSRLWMPLGKRIVIIGGGLVGLELAEFLIERGRQVAVLEPGSRLGRELAIVRRWRVLDNLRSHQVPLMADVSVTRIDDSGVDYRDSNGDSQRLPANSVVMAMGAEPDDSLATQLAAAGLSVQRIGDCGELGYIDGAIHSAAEVALRV